MITGLLCGSVILFYARFTFTVLGLPGPFFSNFPQIALPGIIQNGILFGGHRRSAVGFRLSAFGFKL
jgi:hypothetical protein